MAYTTNRGGFNSAAGSNAGKANVSSPGQAPREAILTSGLFATDSTKSKAIASVQLKEAVKIPAGSYVNLYEVDRKGDKSPVFRLQVRPGVLKSK